MQRIKHITTQKEGVVIRKISPYEYEILYDSGEYAVVHRDYLIFI